MFDWAYAPQVAATAARLDLIAEDVRLRSSRLMRASAECRWDGAGARSFRAASHTATMRLLRASEGLEAAAAALRAHAATVANELARRTHER